MSDKFPKSQTVYITLNARGVPETFHWGIFITSSAPQGHRYHANNISGGWQFESKPHSDPMKSHTLVLLFEIGPILSESGMTDTMKTVPVDGSPSLQTGEIFTCRTWVKDALVALHNEGHVKLRADIDSIERQATTMGGQLVAGIEKGISSAKVYNN